MRRKVREGKEFKAFCCQISETQRKLRLITANCKLITNSYLPLALKASDILFKEFLQTFLVPGMADPELFIAFLLYAA